MYRRIILTVLVISLLFVMTFGCDISQDQTPTETINSEIPPQGQETYHKLDPELTEYLLKISSDELVKVNIWLKCDLHSIDDAIAEKYPEANLIGGRPSKNTDLELWEKIEVERLEAIKQVVKAAEQPVIKFIESSGFEVFSVSLLAPIVFAEISKELILEIQERPDVGTIYKYRDDYVTPTATSVTTTIPLPTGKDIEFETVVIAREPSDRDSPSTAQIIILTDLPESPVKGVLAVHQYKIMEVDYLRYLILITFMGGTYPNEGIEIKRIVQNEDTFNLLAQYPKPQKTVVPGVTYPYHIIKIKKDSITQSGNITFKLFDHWGNERTNITYEILP